MCWDIRFASVSNKRPIELDQAGLYAGNASSAIGQGETVIQERRRDLIHALIVGADEENRRVVLDVFRDAGWHLYQAGDRKRALDCLQRRSVQVVVTNAHIPAWPWKTALRDLQRFPRPPQLVVTSRLADEALWAEALNWGAYDVLAEPLRPDEVERVIAAAGRHFDPPMQRSVRAHAAAS